MEGNKDIEIPWRLILFQKLPVAQLLKNFTTFYGTWRFITVFTIALHWSLSWAITHHPISLRSVSIFSCDSHLGLCSGLFPYAFPTKILYAFLFSLMRVIRHAHRLDNSDYIWRKSTSYEAPCHAIFSNLIPFHPSWVQISSSARCSPTASVSALPLMSETKFHTHTKLQRHRNKQRNHLCPAKEKM
jgi:hypothetical protein